MEKIKLPFLAKVRKCGESWVITVPRKYVRKYNLAEKEVKVIIVVE